MSENRLNQTRDWKEFDKALREEIYSPENLYYASQTLGCHPTEDEAVEYYKKSGGLRRFCEKHQNDFWRPAPPEHFPFSVTMPTSA